MGVARDRHEVERAGARQHAGKIGEEHEGALEDGDQMDSVGMIAMNLERDLPYASLNVLGGNERRQGSQGNIAATA